MRPERWRRGDVVAALGLAGLLAIGTVVLWLTSPVAGTTSATADPPITASTAPPETVPAIFVEAWRAPSAATPSPVVVGPAVVTADGGAVIGREATTGIERWRYERDIPLCTVSGAFRFADGGAGRVLTIFQNGAYCSEMTALVPATGARAEQRNPDVAAGTHVVDGGMFVALTGSDYFEVLRSDLVKTLEYGAVRAPEQPGRQPRPGCRYGSIAVTANRVGVIERCPQETTDRLTVLVADGDNGADWPQEEFSVPLPAGGGVLVAISADRVAVALPNPARLLVYGSDGAPRVEVPLDVPDTDLAALAEAPLAVTTRDGERTYWWTGSHTVALDSSQLVPLWTAGVTLGPGTEYAGRWLLPIHGGLQVLDPARGETLATISIYREDPVAAVGMATQGDVLLEQRGDELVALRPA